MISVIIPAYNCARYLREAVESAVKQDYADLEILIVEDCSADETLALALILEKDYEPVRVIKNQKNSGPAASRNRGIEEAKGDWIAFLDGDDVWHPDKLERQMELIKKSGGSLCYTAYSFINAKSQPIRGTYHIPETVSFTSLLKENVIGLSTSIVRRDVIGDIRMRGDFAHEDYVFWLELLKNGCKPVGLDEPLTRYRVSESNRSGDKKKAARNRWDVYRRFLGYGRLRSAWWFAHYAVCAMRKALR